jgi:D-alanine transaminase
MAEVAFVNGRFMPLAEAVVPVEDRGFQFADGVYEVLATYSGRPYALEPHFKRLECSLKALSIPFDLVAYGLAARVEEGIRHGGFDETLVYMQITRGVASRHHEFPDADTKPTVVMTFKRLQRPPDQLYRDGVSAISTADLRWKRCDIKSISLLANILAKQEAHAAGAYEALLVDENGHVTEGSSTSSFCVHNGQIWTSQSGPHILPSITRGILLELAGRLEIKVIERECALADYLQADEVFLAGTTTEAMPVVAIDGKKIGAGVPGEITRRLRQAFLQTRD